MRMARLQSGKTFCTGCESDLGRLGCTFWLGLDLSVSAHNADVAYAVVFLATAFPKELVVAALAQTLG